MLINSVESPISCLSCTENDLLGVGLTSGDVVVYKNYYMSQQLKLTRHIGSSKSVSVDVDDHIIDIQSLLLAYYYYYCRVSAPQMQLFHLHLWIGLMVCGL